MGFKTELEMKEAASEVLPDKLEPQARELIPEFDYGLGRTDLVFIDISDSYWSHRRERLDIRDAIASKQELITFLQLHDTGPITRQKFFKIGAQKAYQKRRALNWLNDNNFIEELSGGRIQTASNLRRHVTTTIAVELKLSKWREALKQASKGRSYAEYRYVALDQDHIAPAKSNLDKFKATNVGLLSIDEDGMVNFHWKPPKVDPYSELYRWKLNEDSISSLTA